MKLPWLVNILMCALVGATVLALPPRLRAQPAPPNAPVPRGPQLTFATNEYNFGRVTAGTLVKYDFIVTNTGDQSLDISAVAPGCHCTTAGDWTHHLEPGQTGRIPIQFDSGNFRSDVTKTITVTSNDKNAPRQSIRLQGTVWRQIEINPQVAFLNIPADATSNAVSIVRITSQIPEPITLSDPTSINGLFKAELKVIKPGKEFHLVITAVPPLPTGNTVGKITVKTSLTNLPELSITTYATVQAAVAIMPPQVIVPAQRAGWTTNYITINNHQAAPLVLSDPQICCHPQASVELKTVVAGRRFQLVVAVPPDFQNLAGQTAQVTVKSDSSVQPLITVPIRVFATAHSPVSQPMVRPPTLPATNPTNHL